MHVKRAEAKGLRGSWDANGEPKYSHQGAALREIRIDNQAEVSSSLSDS